MTERVVLWTGPALRDLEDNFEYIAEQQPAAALRVFERLQARASQLAAQTLRGRRVPELRELGIDSHRELIEAPWRIIHRPAGDRVYVIAIFDARRNVQNVLTERLLQLH